MLLMYLIYFIENENNFDKLKMTEQIYFSYTSGSSFTHIY